MKMYNSLSKFSSTTGSTKANSKGQHPTMGQRDDRSIRLVPRGGGTPIYGLYRYVPRNRVWFSRFLVLK